MQFIGNFIGIFFNTPAINFLLRYVFGAWFVWLPVLLVYLFWLTWLNYIRIAFLRGLSWTLLEIKIPREIAKSPRAMEVILSAIHNLRDGNLVEKYWQGFLRVWYSLEIASIGGEIHFYIRTQRGFKDFVEAQIYSQYPGAEINEVDDYSQIISINDIGKDWDAWGAQFSLAKEEAYPIRTYVDYGLEASRAKEEEKIDPLTSFLETLGSLRPGEQIWFQIAIRPATSDWKEKAEAIIEKLQQRKRSVSEDTTDTPGFTMLSPGQREVLMAVEHNVSKLGYETGIRAIYLAKKDVFSGTRKSIVSNSLRQHSTQNMNSFKSKTTSVDYFFKSWRELHNKKRILERYQDRQYFYIPYHPQPYVLNTEALATFFHFPGSVARTPTLGRIEAKRGEPPINLPI